MIEIDLIVGLFIFISIYVSIISGWAHRTIVAVLGGLLMVIFQIVPQEKAFNYYVDWQVIFLLVGMMIIVTGIHKSGLLQYIAIKSAKLAKGDPYKIMTYFIFITAFFSAFLDNVTTIIIIAPVSILVAVELGISPGPFLVAEILASNIGGTATLIGDPPNIMIGSAGDLDFFMFIKNLTLPIVVMVLILPFVIKLVAARKLEVSYQRKARIMEFDTSKIIEDHLLLKKSLCVFVMVMIGFFTHHLFNVDVSTIALFGAFFLLLIMKKSKDSLREFLNQVEWVSLFFFIGFFIMVGGLVEIGVIKKMSNFIFSSFGDNLHMLSLAILWFSGLFSSVFDNIPFVATAIPVIKDLGIKLGSGNIVPLWWALALGSCLGGNMTIMGAAANIVASDIAEKNGCKISFWMFFRCGFIVTIINLILATFYILYRYF